MSGRDFHTNPVGDFVADKHNGFQIIKINSASIDHLESRLLGKDQVQEVGRM